MKKWIVLITILIWFTSESLLGQDCEIKVEHNAGNAFVINTESNTESYNAGGWISYSQEHITKIENTGRNDLLIRTRHNNGNIDNYHTINNDDQTIWFPFPNFSGTSLHEVRCLSYATIHDTNDLIDEFGGSAQNLINDAQSAAQQAAEDAKDNMIGLVNVVNYETFQQQAEQSEEEMEQKWEELQQLAAEGAEIGEVILSEHFPELHEAIQATASLNVNIPYAAVQTREQNLENLQAKLQEMDDKYEVSSNINAFAGIDLEEQFPEIFAIDDYQCSVDLGVIEQLEDEFIRFFSAFQALMAEAISEADLPVFRLTSREMDQLAELIVPPPCFSELQDSHRLLIQDLNEFLDFVKSVHANLGKWEARWFTKGNESIYEDSQRLLTSSERLIRLLNRQIALEQEASKAREEMDRSYQKAVSGYGRYDAGRANTEQHAFVGQVLFPKDAEQIEQDLEDHRATIDRYERALNNRDRGWENIRQESANWMQQALSLAESVTRLRLEIRVAAEFNSLMGDPVELNFPKEAIQLAQSCVNSASQSMGTVIRIFNNALGRYLAELREKLQLLIPDELYVALELQFEIISEIRTDLTELADFALTATKLGQSYGQMTIAYADLGAALAQIPSDPGYLSNVESKVSTLSDRAQQLSSDRTDFDQTLASAGPNLEVLWDAVMELNVNLEANRSDLSPAAARLLQSTISFESTLNGLNDLAESASECTTGKLDLVKKALTTFPDRSQKFMDLIAGMALNTVPDEVKQSIGNLIQLTNEQVSNYAELGSWEVIEEEIINQQTIVMATANLPLDFVQYHNEFLLALMPVPQPDALPKLEILVQSFDDMVIETEELRSVIEEIVETDRQAMQELRSLNTWARTQETEVANDFAELTLIVFDASPLLSEIDKVEDVGALWAVAAIETPARLEALTVGEIAQRLEELRPQVEQALQNLATQTAAGISCAADAIQSRTTIANQPVSAAVSQATDEISSSAYSVYNDLQNLSDPTANLLTTVEQIISAGQDLMQDVQQSADAGQSAFESLVSGSYQQMQQAITCVDSRSQSIEQIAGELSNYYSEIEGNQFPQMQFIQGTINFNPNN